MSSALPIVVVQTRPSPWDPAATLERLERQVRLLQARHPDTRLYLYPEYHLAAFGPFLDSPPPEFRAEASAEQIPGPTTDRLCTLAAELGVWLLPGTLYERDPETGRIYNTALAIAPSGEIAARYRKVFPWRPWERVSAGDEFAVFDVDGVGRAGLMICYDGWFPEIPRQLAWLGAEVIFQPSLTTTSDRQQELTLAKAHAIMNQVYVVNVNTAQPTGTGMSIVVDPEGHALQVAGSGEEYLTETIDFEAPRRVRRYGSVALARMWEQLDAEAADLHLPMYADGCIRPRPVGVERDRPSAATRPGR
jgi:formamidase